MQKEKYYKIKYWLIPAAMLFVFGILILQSGSVTAELNSPDAPTWDSEIHVSTNSPNGAFVPVIDRAPDGTLMVVYRHRTAGAFNIPYFSQSTSNGTNWSTPAPVRNSPVDIPQVTFAFDSNSKAHAVWRTDTDLFHADEDTWPGPGTPIVATLETILDPDIDIAPDNTIHVVWAQGENLSYIYHAYSQSGGLGWTLSPPLALNNRKSTAPTVSVDNNGNVHVAWEERIFNIGQNEFITEIRYKKGTWAGNTLTFDANPTTISDPNVNSNRPDIVATSDGRVHISYMELISDDEQYAMYALYNGTTWLTPVAINDVPVGVNQSDPFFLITTLDVCNVAYLYFHGALSPTANEQILGGNSGDNWTFIEQVTDPSTRSINPSLVCNGSQLYLAFTRIEQSGINQIYVITDAGGEAFLPTVYKN